MGANLFEHPLALALDVLRVHNAFTAARLNQRSQNRSTSGSRRRSSSSSHSRSNAYKTGSAFRFKSWLNWLTPRASRQQLSPSIMAFFTDSLARAVFRDSNRRFFRLR